MSALIPPLDLQRVLVDPWTIDAGLKVWIVVMGFLVALACGLVGQYLMLRRMALMGDAISHSVLPGLAGSFLISAWFFGRDSGGGGLARSTTAMYLGALLAALVTTLLIEWLHRRSRLKQDAAMGTVFTGLFALGVVLITVFADHVDLDADCVLHGEIGFVPFHEMVRIGGVVLGPQPVVRMAVVAAITAILIVAFYKELLVSSFDPGLATSLGVNATVVHFLLMGWLAVIIVSAFEAVGAILVVAMLILPGATAALVSHRLPVILLLVAVQAALSSVLGLHLALWLDCSIAGAMVVAGAFLFALAWTWSGLRRRWDRRKWAGAPSPADHTPSAPEKTGGQPGNDPARATVRSGGSAVSLGPATNLA